MHPAYECKCRRIALGVITNKINDENNIIVNNVIVNNVKYVDICEIVDANFVNKDGISSKREELPMVFCRYTKIINYVNSTK